VLWTLLHTPNESMDARLSAMLEQVKEAGG
jgi:hypothetical protein